ncbi:MAG: DUF4838 domain-containing protein [Clostridia bacterium]|nr:DUF4838 domain-containing protein [Clostridia bacterium]
MSAILTKDSAVMTAAAELNRYLERMGVSIKTELKTDPALPGDGLRITVEDGTVRLLGGNGRGVLYACYRLLELLGCRFYAEDTEVIPTPTPDEVAAVLPEGLDLTEVSPFEFRDLYWTCTYRPDFAVKRRINAGLAGGGSHRRDISPEWGGCIGYAGPHFVHTFERLVPAQEFFESHPEYFSMIDGERTAKHLYSQLCLSNPEVLAIVIERVKGWLRENPLAEIVSVSQNDSFVIQSYCTCPACAAVDAEEGSPAGSLIRFVNAVAEAIEPEFPKVAIDTLAYQYSTVPPKLTRPRHNVMVRMCTGGCSSHAIDECDRNGGTRQWIEGWEKICDRLYIWDYTTDFAQYLNPFPNLPTHQRNAKFFASHNVKGVFEQGNYTGGKSGEFGELRSFILTEVLWDPDRTPDTVGFMEAYYGAGAPFVQKYLDYIHEKVKDLHFNLVISAANLWNPLIPDGDIPMLDALWADAYTAALAGGTTAGGFGIPAELAARHVERSALCHRWFKLDGKRGEFADESAFEGLMNAFYADCKRLEVTRLNEGADVPWVEVE